MSGFLGNILGNILGGGQAGGASASGIGGLIGQAINAAGGPAGVIQKFEQAGLGDQARSWVGQGENQTVTPQQVQQVFPTGQIESWAQQHGIPSGVAAEVLAHVLPHAVDAQTPDGSVPPAGAPQADPANIDFAGLLGRLAGRG